MVWSFFSWLNIFFAFFSWLSILISAKEKNSKPHIFQKSQFTQTETKYTQPKRIYSADGNPFIPMIDRFYAPLLFPDLCASLINNITLLFGPV